MKLIIALLLTTSMAYANSTNNDAPSARNDAKISAILMEANNADIDASMTAKRKTNNAEVRSYAVAMVNEHNSNNHELQQVMERANIKTRQNQESKNIKNSTRDAKNNYKSLNGDAFDRAYIDNEVSNHSQVLNTLDQDLIPNAKSPNLKAHLIKSRTTIAEHLDHAKRIQTQISI